MKNVWLAVAGILALSAGSGAADFGYVTAKEIRGLEPGAPAVRAGAPAETFQADEGVQEARAKGEREVLRAEALIRELRQGKSPNPPFNDEAVRDFAGALRELSAALGNYRLSHWDELGEKRRAEMESTEWDLLNTSSDLITLAVQLVLESGQPGPKTLESLDKATARAKDAIGGSSAAQADCGTINCWDPCTQGLVTVYGNTCNTVYDWRRQCMAAYGSCNGTTCGPISCWDQCTREMVWVYGNSCAQIYDYKRGCFAAAGRCS